MKKIAISYFHYAIDNDKCSHFPCKNYLRIKDFEELHVWPMQSILITYEISTIGNY